MKMPFVGLKQLLLVTCAVFTIGYGVRSEAQDQAPPPANNEAPAPEQAQPSQLSPQQLQELVAPIALYPDALVAQILAASAYPTQIVEAERFLQQNPDLKGAALGAEVDKQDWDPSVKALTQFPSVLADMDKNLSWTSSLGDANVNQQADVMDAVQYMREKAREAGNLRTTPQQVVSDDGPSIVIQPADPDVVYVPDYDPDLIYGYPVGLWPGFYPWWAAGGPYLSFGIGFGVGPFGGFGWGWNRWGCDWYNRGLLYGGGAYAFHSHAFYDRNAYFHGNYRGYAPYGRGDRFARGFGGEGRRFGSSGGHGFAGHDSAGRGSAGHGFAGHGLADHGSASRGFAGSRAPGFTAPRSGGFSGTRSGAFGGFSHGGFARSFSSRGSSSFGGGGMRGGGGGGMRGGSGGMHGGGGGGRR